MAPERVERIIFYNHWHNGDIHLSRPMVQDVMRKMPGRQFIYSHPCPADLLIDVEGLANDRTLLPVLPAYDGWAVDENTRTVALNTWIGVAGVPLVFERGGHTIGLMHELMAICVRNTLGIELLPLEQCIPDPDFSRFHIRHVNEFVKQDPRRKVLVSNGLVQSQQSVNFDFTPLIERLSQQFPQVLFIATNACPLQRGNVRCSADIIRKGAPDLNENGYLGTFCDLIVGRSSGSYTFSMNRTNLRLPKTFIGFVNRPLECTFRFHEPRFGAKCRFFASNNYQLDDMNNLVSRCVSEFLPAEPAIGKVVEWNPPKLQPDTAAPGAKPGHSLTQPVNKPL